ncbi:MAG TPA: hypothetical protein VGN14_14870, partial [Candidatus Elarobacter sp.]
MLDLIGQCGGPATDHTLTFVLRAGTSGPLTRGPGGDMSYAMSDIETEGGSIRYDSSTTADADRDDRHSLQTYVSDMLALERHIDQPLKAQLGIAERYPDAKAAVSQMFALCQNHVTALTECLASLGGHEASPIKSAWSTLLGFGAAAIDSARKTKVSKSLR